MKWEMQVSGMAELSETLSQLEDDAPAVAARALYKGAGVMNRAIVEKVKAIKTAPFKYAKEGEKRLPSPEEKEALIAAGVGIAKFDKEGTEIDTSVGFNSGGYVNVNFRHMSGSARTNYKAYTMKGRPSTSTSFMRAMGISTRGTQNQKPVGVIANSINSGTSFMTRQPFFRSGVNSGKTKAMQAMKDSIEQDWRDRLINHN